MSYVNPAQVQSWLQVNKYNILAAEGVNAEQEQLAAEKILATLEQRYDTSGWTDNTNTPGMVLRMIAMLTASYMLRKAISEDDGTTFYCDWLEGRVDALLAGLVDGSIDLPGVDPDPTAPAAASVGFYPTDASTQEWLDDTNGNATSVVASEGAARWFTMQKVF